MTRNGRPVPKTVGGWREGAPVSLTKSLAVELALHITGEFLNVNGGSVLCGG